MRPTIFCVVVMATGLVVSASACHEQGSGTPVVTVAEPPRATASADEAPAEPVAIAPIEPGKKIDVAALPKGTHVVFRSKPKVSSGDVTKVSQSIRNSLESYVTLVLVETEPDPANAGSFRRAAHRIGIAKPGDGGDLVFTKDTAKTHGVSLGLFDRKVLQGREAELATVKSPGASATTALFDYGMVFRRDDKRVPITVRYLALVDQATGDIQTVYWVLDKTGDALQFHGDTAWVLPKNHVMDWEMHVDGGEVTFGAPSADAFTSTKLPEGTPKPVTAEFKTLAAAKAYGATSVAQLERQARDLIGGAATAK
jgi:hypothetical protein